MKLPESLQQAIQEECSRTNISKNIQASSELSHRYREQNAERYIVSHDQRMAYLIARMPATFASVLNVLTKTSERIPNLNPTSLLDLGAGPGTASWAATELFPSLKNLTLVEQDGAMIDIGKRLASQSHNSGLRAASWFLENLLTSSRITPHDLIIFSYSIGELPQDAWNGLLKKAWDNVKEALVIIEPGTPKGFEKIREIRKILISFGASIIAPCPHQSACPISGNDWCHFSQRLERTVAHRRTKEASLSYEDEKFSYVVVSKLPFDPITGRVIRHPMKHTGHVGLTICSEDGTIDQKTISKRDKELYKWARKSSWGDVLPSD